MQTDNANQVPDPTPQFVFQAISAVAGGDARADAALKQWETDAAPGFLQLLMAIVEQTDNISEVS